MSYGLKVSKPGHDVKTAADKDLVYSSEWATFTVFAANSGSISYSTGSVTTVTINHNLGYRPAFTVYTEVPFVSGFVQTPIVIPGGVDRSCIARVTTTQLIIRWAAGFHSSNATFAYRYFIYYNRAI
jgi:hypothetical protein